MDSLIETIVIAGAVLLALAFLVQRYLVRNKSGACRSKCNCTRPEPIKRRS